MFKLGPVAKIAGSALSAFGNYQAGKAAARAGRAQQKADNAAAVQQLAASQREMLDQRRQAHLLASRALAVAAAGGGADDPSTLHLIADINGEGAYRSALALYGGEAKAQQLRAQGEAAARAGRQKRSGFNLSALGNMMTLGTTLYTKYGMASKST